MNKKVFPLIVILVFLGILVILIYSLLGPISLRETNQSNSLENSTSTILPENTNRQNILESTNQNMGGIEKITFKEVSKHNSPEDCWIIINQKVYDITNFIALGEHPPQIELGCGKDSTKLFETRTTETGEKIGSGTPHSENARKLLERYYIGDLQ